MRSGQATFPRRIAGDLRSDHAAAVQFQRHCQCDSRVADRAAGRGACCSISLSRTCPGDVQNYHLLTTAQSNTTQAGVRYMRSLGKNATLLGGGRGGGGGRRNQNQGLRQSINFNYNWSHSASDQVNIFPQLGGKTASDSNSVQAGYTVGYHRVTNIFNASWNRSNSQTTNFFTNGPTLRPMSAFLGRTDTALNSSPLNYGLPSVILSSITGLNQQQPSFSLSQTSRFRKR